MFIQDNFRMIIRVLKSYIGLYFVKLKKTLEKPLIGMINIPIRGFSVDQTTI